MGMSVGGSTLVVVERTATGMQAYFYSSRLDAVKAMVANGALGGGLCYGDDEHKMALAAVEEQIAATRKRIAEMEAEDAEKEPKNV